MTTRKQKKCLIYGDDHSNMTGNCFHCGVKGGLPTYSEKIRMGADATPIEIRQKFLDLMWAGRNVGQASKEAGIEDTGIASQILLDNIESASFLSTKAK